MDFDYDLYVIGGGSGGVRAARVSAQAGARVGLAEDHRMGGTCVIRGCVPKKLMVYASSFSELFEDAKGYGWSVGETSWDWSKFMAAKDAEIERLEQIYRRNLANAGVEIHDARASIADPHTVELSDGTRYTAKHILVATGGWPFIPEFPGNEHAITSNEIFELKTQPKRVLVVGGGYIASEFACILNGMGSKVTQYYRSEQILRGFDNDVRDHVADEMRKKGVDIQTKTDVASIEKSANELIVTRKDGGTIIVDQVLYATGRVPKSDNIGLEQAGVEFGKGGAIAVDEWSQTNIPSIYAVGDVTNRVALTPVAIREGAAFAETVFKANRTKADHELIPTAVFTQPEIGTVGLGEEDARKDYDVEIYKTSFRAMFHILADRDEKVFMKLVVDKATRVVLGVHVVGHGSGELIQAVGIAVKMGATKEQFDQTVAVHPTAAEELVTMKEPVAS